MTKTLARILRMTLALLVVLAVGAFAATETAAAENEFNLVYNDSNFNESSLNLNNIETDHSGTLYSASNMYTSLDPSSPPPNPSDNTANGGGGNPGGGTDGNPGASGEADKGDGCPHRKLINKYYTFIEDEDGTMHQLDALCEICGADVTMVEKHQYSIGWHGGEVCYLCRHDTEGVEHTWDIRTGLCEVCLCQEEHSEEYCPINDKYYDAAGNETPKTGLITYDGAEFYLVNGRLQKNANGPTQIGDKYYFLAGGMKQDHSGFAKHGNEWYYLDKGELDTGANGIYDYDGGRFLVNAGRLAAYWNGPAQVSNGEWYYIGAGRVLTELNGTINWQGKTYRIEHGKLLE